MRATASSSQQPLNSWIPVSQISCCALTLGFCTSCAELRSPQLIIDDPPHLLLMSFDDALILSCVCRTLLIGTKKNESTKKAANTPRSRDLPSARLLETLKSTRKTVVSLDYISATHTTFGGGIFTIPLLLPFWNVSRWPCVSRCR
jgi:hypothetical protein